MQMAFARRARAPSSAGVATTRNAGGSCAISSSGKHALHRDEPPARREMPRARLRRTSRDRRTRARSRCRTAPAARSPRRARSPLRRSAARSSITACCRNAPFLWLLSSATTCHARPRDRERDRRHAAAAADVEHAQAAARGRGGRCGSTASASSTWCVTIRSGSRIAVRLYVAVPLREQREVARRAGRARRGGSASAARRARSSAVEAGVEVERASSRRAPLVSRRRRASPVRRRGRASDARAAARSPPA